MSKWLTVRAYGNDQVWVQCMHVNQLSIASPAYLHRYWTTSWRMLLKNGLQCSTSHAASSCSASSVRSKLLQGVFSATSIQQPATRHVCDAATVLLLAAGVCTTKQFNNRCEPCPTTRLTILTANCHSFTPCTVMNSTVLVCCCCCYLVARISKQVASIISHTAFTSPAVSVSRASPHFS